jgi:hypothetical protein
MIQHYGSQLLSCFPTQKMQSFGERCIVPLMNWLLLAFLPLRLVQRSRRPAWVAANGQFMVFEKKAYEAIDGHRSVYNRIVEDMELARSIKRKGYRCLTVLGGDSIFCRMYEGFSTALRGFSKNFCAGFNMPVVWFILFLLGIVLLFVFPLYAVWFEPRYGIAIGLILSARVLASKVSHQSTLWNLLLHPIQMVLFVIVGIASALATAKGSIVWKGRSTHVRKKITQCVFLIALCLSLSTGIGVAVGAETTAVKPTEIEMRMYLRENFAKALPGQKEVDLSLRYIQDNLNSDPGSFPSVIMAYYGSLQGLKAKYASLPMKKCIILRVALSILTDQ